MGGSDGRGKNSPLAIPDEVFGSGNRPSPVSNWRSSLLWPVRILLCTEPLPALHGLHREMDQQAQSGVYPGSLKDKWDREAFR